MNSQPTRRRVCSKSTKKGPGMRLPGMRPMAQPRGKLTLTLSGGQLTGKYEVGTSYDEMVAEPGQPRASYRRIFSILQKTSAADLRRRQALAQRSFRDHGITFTVQNDERGLEKLFPFDLVPRVIAAQTWARLEAGLKQRVLSLNLFLADIYGKRQILKQRAVPPEIVLSSTGFLRELTGMPTPQGLHCHIS